MPNELPLNWCECKLEIVCALDSGLKQNGLDLPLLDAKYLRGKKEAEYRQEGVVLNPEDYVILVDGENSGEIFSIYETGIMGSTFKKLSFSKFCSVPYALFFIRSKQDLFRTNKKGAAIPHLDKTLFKNLTFPLPPLAEQERIVEKIEALFAGIDEGIERLKSAQAKIKQYRQSVLKSAFEGKLYKTTDWKEVQLKDVCEFKSGNTIDTKLEKSSGSIPYIKVGDMNLSENSISIVTSSRFVDMVDIKQNQLIPTGSVIFPKRGGAIATNKKRKVIKPIIIDLNTMAIIPSDKLHTDFFYFWILKIDLMKLSNGGNIPQINNYSFDKVTIPLPSLPEQQHIVEEIEKRFAVADELEKAVNEGLEKADKLKQSILKKAFEGKLVAQNPNDEPASILLARIQKEQKPTKGKKK